MNEETNGPFSSGLMITVDHSWKEKDEYEIRVREVDEFGLKTKWGTLRASMPKK